MKKTVSALIALMLVVILAAGCGRKEFVFFEYDLSGKPSTLDPQFASTQTERIIAANVFEGLVVTESDGKISPGCAESWEETNGVCTFTLRDGLVWSDGVKVTADDFVFAFERMFSPTSPSPYADSYLFIKGAREVLSGVKPVSSLGVSAKDEKTVEIRLTGSNAQHMTLLAQTPAMPCRRDFFTEQKGRYGLSGKNTVTNGAYDLYSWGDETIKLRKNENYRNPMAIDGINLNLSRRDAHERYEEGLTDACLFENAIGHTETEGIVFYSAAWSLVLNPNSEAFARDDVRKLIIGSLSEEMIEERIETPLRKSEGLISPEFSIGGLSCREAAGAVKMPAHIDDAREKLLAIYDELEIEKLPKATLLVSEDAYAASLGGAMQREWSDTLSCYFNLEPVPESTLLYKVWSGEFDFAITPMPDAAGSMTAGLELFADLLGENDTYAITEKISDVSKQPDAASAAKSLLKAQQAVVNASLALPIYDTPSLFACNKNFSGVWYDPMHEIIYFRDARKL